MVQAPDPIAGQNKGKGPSQEGSPTLNGSLNGSPKLAGIVEFWAVLLAPWILDLLGHRGVMASVFGAVLWGVAVVLSVARSKTKDVLFKSRQGYILAAIAGLWLLYWIYAFTQPIGKALFFDPVEPRIFHTLIIVHAGLLAAGAGIVLVLWFTSLLWILRERLLRRSSWQRRSKNPLALPSLEALGKVDLGAVHLAFASWGLGFLFAMINGILKWQPASARNSFFWVTDPKVLGTAVLWVTLVVAFQLSHTLSSSNRWLHRLLLLLATFFLFAFVWWFMLGRTSALHEPIDWFVR